MIIELGESWHCIVTNPRRKCFSQWLGTPSSSDNNYYEFIPVQLELHKVAKLRLLGDIFTAMNTLCKSLRTNITVKSSFFRGDQYARSFCMKFFLFFITTSSHLDRAYLKTCNPFLGVWFYC